LETSITREGGLNRPAVSLKRSLNTSPLHILNPTFSDIMTVDEMVKWAKHISKSLGEVDKELPWQTAYGILFAALFFFFFSFHLLTVGAKPYCSQYISMSFFFFFCFIIL
jgi:hypothetical protein